VECLTDCDCAANEFCGPDLPFPELESKSDSNKQKQFIKRLSEQLHGVKVKSRCFKYNSEIVGRVCNPIVTLNNIYESLNEQGYCGFITNFQPNATGCSGNNCGSIHPKPNPDFHRPGTCYDTVSYTSQEILNGFCSVGNPFENMGSDQTDANSTEIIWQGICAHHTCHVCQEQEMRCVGNGIPQICANNAWIEITTVDFTGKTLARNAVAQILIAISVFTGLLFVMGISLCFKR